MKSLIINLLKKERVERAIKTFIESFFSYIAVNVLVTDLTSKSAVYALLSGAIASAMSVVFNYKKNSTPEGV